MKIEIEDLSLDYRGGTRALDRLSLTLEPGRIYGLIGRNGSGKTSLLSVLAGFRRASGGRVRIDGGDPFDNERVTSRICLIRESGDIMATDKCRRVLDFARWLRPNWDQAYAEKLVDRFRIPLDKTAQSLSRGQRSALACTLGLASRSELTMLDESYLGMDAPTRYAFYEELLADYSLHPRTFIISTHLIEEFGSLFEEVVMIHKGRLLLRAEAEELRSQGAAVTGPAEAVAAFLAEPRPGEPGAPTVLAERSLGGTRSVTLHGELTADDRRRAHAAGLTLEPVALQDLFVHLTADGSAAEEAPS